MAAVVGDGVVDGGEGSEEAGQVAEQNRVCRVLGKYALLEEALSNIDPSSPELDLGTLAAPDHIVQLVLLRLVQQVVGHALGAEVVVAVAEGDLQTLVALVPVLRLDLVRGVLGRDHRVPRVIGHRLRLHGDIFRVLGSSVVRINNLGPAKLEVKESCNKTLWSGLIVLLVV